MNYVKLLYEGEVVFVAGDNMPCVIRVRIPDFDSRVSNENLPMCYPLVMGSYILTPPKVGERVAVLMDRVYVGDRSINQEKRYWLGIVVSGHEKIGGDPYYYTSSSNQSDGYTLPSKDITKNPKARGTYPEGDQIAFRGRFNTDILHKNGEILIRAGRHLDDNVVEFNRNDPTFIQLKYGAPQISKNKKKTIVPVVEQIAPLHEIVALDDDLNLTIEVRRLSDDLKVESLSEGFATRNELVGFARNKILELEKKYPQWVLSNSIPELSDMPINFPNNTRTIRKEVIQEEKNTPDADNRSVINAVAQKINLLSHASKQDLNLTDPSAQISDEEQQKINEQTQPMVYGEKLLDLLKLFQKFVESHSHQYDKLPPAQRAEVERAIVQFDLSSLLNPNIRHL